MLSEVKKASSAIEFETAERCHITEIANDPGDPQVSIARARVEPGVTTAWHRLDDISERYIIISGRGLVEVDELDPTPVTVGDVVRIAAGKAQRITNTGSDELIFYAVCTPAFKQTSYVSLE